jgi:hypothetical protein
MPRSPENDPQVVHGENRILLRQIFYTVFAGCTKRGKWREVAP